jgi:hypothetical protein
MSSEQLPAKIKEVAMELDNALEKRNYELIKSYFAKDCKIEFLDVILRGRKGVEKWLDYIFEHVKAFELKPILIMVENDSFFEEFTVIATLPDGSKISSKWAEVLVYKDYKVQSLRLYFDRLNFIKSIPSNLIVRKLLRYIDKKSLEGLN